MMFLYKYLSRGDLIVLVFFCCAIKYSPITTHYKNPYYKIAFYLEIFIYSIVEFVLVKILSYNFMCFCIHK